MGKTAFVYPGQGSQYVGMGADCYERNETAKRLWDRADALIGAPLSSVCFRGPEEELRQTRTTQPGIFVHSFVTTTLATGAQPDMVAGHSLGEYTALVFAGAMSFEDGLRIVRLRGELMQRAGEEQKGTMAAIVGLTPQQIEEVCQQAYQVGIVRPANFNSPGQIVISGSVEGVHKAMDLARRQGARLVKELVVSGAFHSPLMESAQDGLEQALHTIPLRDATVPIYTNVTAEPVTTAADIREMLTLQITRPVQWEQTIRNMRRDGADRFYELGPGKVLQGLIKRTEADVQVRSVDTYADVQMMIAQNMSTHAGG